MAILCTLCNKKPVTTGKVMRLNRELNMLEVEIMTRCVYCRSLERRINALQTDIYLLEDKLQEKTVKLTNTEYILYNNIYGNEIKTLKTQKSLGLKNPGFVVRSYTLDQISARSRTVTVA
jgi:chromosome segregation ATPase